MRAVCTLAGMELRRQFCTSRLILFCLAGLIPPAVALFWVLNRGLASGQELLGNLFILMYLHFLVPYASLFFAASLFSTEVQGRTLPYLLLRPVRRLELLLGKFAAYLLWVGALVSISLTISVMVLWTGSGGTLEGIGLAWTCLVASWAAVLAYGGLFTLAGVVLKKPVVPAVAFLIIWEGVVSNFAGMLNRLTLVFYLRSLFLKLSDVLVSSIATTSPPDLKFSAVVLASVTLMTLALAWWGLTRLECVATE